MRDTKMQEVTMEVTVGAFMLILFLLVAAFSIFISQNNLFVKKYEYKIVFANVSGLVNGNAVHYRGIPFGQVKNMEVLQTHKGVEVTIATDSEIVLHTDYSIKIVTASALGGRWLIVDEGSLDKPEISDYDHLIGFEPTDIIEEATKLVSEVREALDEGALLHNLSIAATNLKDVSSKINSSEGSLGKLVNDSSLYDNLNDTLASVRAITQRINDGKGTLGRLVSEDDTLYDDLAVLSANLNTISTRLVDGKGTLGKVLSEDEELYQNLNSFVANLGNAEGTVGKLLNDDELYEALLSLVNEAQATIDDMRETSPITTFSSIFFGAF